MKTYRPVNPSTLTHFISPDLFSSFCVLSSRPSRCAFLSTRPPPCLPGSVRSVSDWRAQSAESPPSSEHHPESLSAPPAAAADVEGEQWQLWRPALTAGWFKSEQVRWSGSAVSQKWLDSCFLKTFGFSLESVAKVNSSKATFCFCCCCCWAILHMPHLFAAFFINISSAQYAMWFVRKRWRARKSDLLKTWRHLICLCV